MTAGETQRKGLWFGALAVLVICCGLLLNEYFIAFAFSPDGELSASTIWQLRGLMGGLVAAGILLVLSRDRLETRALDVVRRHPNTSALVLGLSVSAGCIVLIEAVYHSLGTIRARRSEQVTQAPVLLPGTATKASLTVRGEIVYDVAYNIDEHYARKTSSSARTAPATKDLYFFGGSFVFGEGVEDDETLPSIVARAAPDWRVTNFGFPGHGPAQMLQRLESDAPLQDVAGADAMLVYVFIPGHVRRVIGSMRVATSWGRDFPRYALNAEDELVRLGNFSDSRPFISKAYAFLSRERILSYYNVDFPSRIGPKHLSLTTRVIADSRERFLARFGSDEFYVVLYPSNPRDEFPAQDLIPYLDAVDVSYFDYTDLFDDGEGYWLPHDEHPTALAHEALGARLVRDLGLEAF